VARCGSRWVGAGAGAFGFVVLVGSVGVGGICRARSSSSSGAGFRALGGSAVSIVADADRPHGPRRRTILPWYSPIAPAPGGRRPNARVQLRAS